MRSLAIELLQGMRSFVGNLSKKSEAAAARRKWDAFACLRMIQQVFYEDSRSFLPSFTPSQESSLLGSHSAYSAVPLPVFILQLAASPTQPVDSKSRDFPGSVSVSLVDTEHMLVQLNLCIEHPYSWCSQHFLQGSQSEPGIALYTFICLFLVIFFIQLKKFLYY